MTRAQRILETPCSFERATKKLAKARGDYGAVGGWIRNRQGNVICQGWGKYASRFVGKFLFEEVDTGKWYVWQLGLSWDDQARAETAWPEG